MFSNAKKNHTQSHSITLSPLSCNNTTPNVTNKNHATGRLVKFCQWDKNEDWVMSPPVLRSHSISICAICQPPSKHIAYRNSCLLAPQTDLLSHRVLPLLVTNSHLFSLSHGDNTKVIIGTTSSLCFKVAPPHRRSSPSTSTYNNTIQSALNSSS